jgi:hypothetical protein
VLGCRSLKIKLDLSIESLESLRVNVLAEYSKEMRTCIVGERRRRLQLGRRLPVSGSIWKRSGEDTLHPLSVVEILSRVRGLENTFVEGDCSVCVRKDGVCEYR